MTTRKRLKTLSLEMFYKNKTKQGFLDKRKLFQLWREAEVGDRKGQLKCYGLLKSPLEL